MRNEALTSEAASLADQLALLDKSEKELQLDRTRKLEELSDLRQRLEVMMMMMNEPFITIS
jgi:hypothetical protein